MFFFHTVFLLVTVIFCWNIDTDSLPTTGSLHWHLRDVIIKKEAEEAFNEKELKNWKSYDGKTGQKNRKKN